MNAICLVIDRLHRGFLGAYGNTWVETPAFDRLAAESFAFDQMLIDSPRLGPLYRSYWQGLHALAPDVEGRASLPALLREPGVRSTLMTDDRAVREHPLTIEFDEVVEIDPPWQSQMAAEGAYEETHLARCFLQMIEWVQSGARGTYVVGRQRVGDRSSFGATLPAWARPGMRRGNVASATGVKAIRRFWPPPTCPTAGCRRATTPTTCSSTRRHMPDRSRSWTPAWAGSLRCWTMPPPHRRRCLPLRPHGAFRWANTCGWDRATRPCTASWSTCR